MTDVSIIESIPEALRFTLSGHAVFTLVSGRTGDRVTYRVKLRKRNGETDVFFVDLLTGPDNTEDYTPLGIMTRRKTGLTFTSRTPGVSPEAKSLAAFRYLITVLNSGRFEFGNLEFWHSGRCGRCGRLLTDPESIARGLGPKCAEITS